MTFGTVLKIPKFTPQRSDYFFAELTLHERNSVATADTGATRNHVPHRVRFLELPRLEIPDADDTVLAACQ